MASMDRHTSPREVHTSPREIVTDLVMVWILGALAMAGALLVLGGLVFLQGTTMQIAIGAMLLAAVVFLVHQHRHRDELLKDPRLRAARERRGF